MDNNLLLLTASALFTKHWVVDFMFQPPYMYKNKGTYGHPGGIVHAGLHGLTSAALFGFLPGGLWLCVAEFVIHYHIDWAKMNLNRVFGWGPMTSENFWRLLGFDQWLHAMTYIWMLWMVA